MSAELLIFLFVTSMFLGIELIRKVPGNLHTPLMSGSNAISGISLVGAIFAIGAALEADSTIGLGLAAAATGFAAINVVGGYLVTDRMLTMLGGTAPAAGGKTPQKNARESKGGSS